MNTVSINLAEAQRILQHYYGAGVVLASDRLALSGLLSEANRLLSQTIGTMDWEFRRLTTQLDEDHQDLRWRRQWIEDHERQPLGDGRWQATAPEDRDLDWMPLGSLLAMAHSSDYTEKARALRELAYRATTDPNVAVDIIEELGPEGLQALVAYTLNEMRDVAAEADTTISSLPDDSFWDRAVFQVVGLGPGAWTGPRPDLDLLAPLGEIVGAATRGNPPEWLLTYLLGGHSPSDAAGSRRDPLDLAPTLALLAYGVYSTDALDRFVETVFVELDRFELDLIASQMPGNGGYGALAVPSFLFGHLGDPAATVLGAVARNPEAAHDLVTNPDRVGFLFDHFRNTELTIPVAPPVAAGSQLEGAAAAVIAAGFHQYFLDLPPSVRPRRIAQSERAFGDLMTAANSGDRMNDQMRLALAQATNWRWDDLIGRPSSASPDGDPLPGFLTDLVKGDDALAMLTMGLADWSAGAIEQHAGLPEGERPGDIARHITQGYGHLFAALESADGDGAGHDLIENAFTTFVMHFARLGLAATGLTPGWVAVATFVASNGLGSLINAAGGVAPDDFTSGDLFDYLINPTRGVFVDSDGRGHLPAAALLVLASAALLRSSDQGRQDALRWAEDHPTQWIDGNGSLAPPDADATAEEQADFGRVFNAWFEHTASGPSNSGGISETLNDLSHDLELHLNTQLNSQQS